MLLLDAGGITRQLRINSVNGSIMMGRRNSSYRTFIFALSIVLCLCAGAYGQTKERPRLKNFGSSLEKLKWDSERKVAVEAKRKDARSASSSDDVVRVETNLVVSDVLVLDL